LIERDDLRLFIPIISPYRLTLNPEGDQLIHTVGALWWRSHDHESPTASRPLESRPLGPHVKHISLVFLLDHEEHFDVTVAVTRLSDQTAPLIRQLRSLEVWDVLTTERGGYFQFEDIWAAYSVFR
jgi:hypothetical protein